MRISSIDLGGEPTDSVRPQREVSLRCPFVEEADHFFLKTVIPSRKATRDYLQQGEPNAKG